MGRGADFLKVAVQMETDECVIWPFSLSSGRAYVYEGGSAKKASHLVLGLSGCPRPSPQHQALHDPACNNPACVNKRHLRWGTALENQLDRFKSGTMTPAKLNEADVAEIRRSPEPAQRLAEQYGVIIGTIYDIRQRVTWKHVK